MTSVSVRRDSTRMICWTFWTDVPVVSRQLSSLFSSIDESTGKTAHLKREPHNTEKTKCRRKSIKENRNNKRSDKNSSLHSRKLSQTFLHCDQRCKGKKEHKIWLRILILPFAHNHSSMRLWSYRYHNSLRFANTCSRRMYVTLSRLETAASLVLFRLTHWGSNKRKTSCFNVGLSLLL